LGLIAPHIVILDMHLPHVDGGTLLTQIRASEVLKDTTVVIVTADALMGDMYRDQADFVFIKPTTFTQLRDFTSRLKK
jgi:CheY-like chemotaxis protein